MTTKMTLSQFRETHSLTALWVLSEGQSDGQQYVHNVDSDGDYCDLAELTARVEATGAVSYQGAASWTWDGQGGLCDPEGNAVLSLIAFAS